MMILDGYVKSINHNPIEDVAIKIIDGNFNVIYSTKSNKDGYYQFDLPEGRYPFLIAVKDYKTKYLEYWCQNICLSKRISLDVSYDKLEIYGLHVFSIKGGGNGLFVYFRPMSLVKAQQGMENIAPDDISIQVKINEKDAVIIKTNKVVEVAAHRELTAYLIQIEGNDNWNKVEVTIRDAGNNYGAASIFNDNVLV